MVLLGDVGPRIVLLLGEPRSVGVELLAIEVEGDNSLHRHLMIISHNTKNRVKKREKGKEDMKGIGMKIGVGLLGLGCYNNKFMFSAQANR